MTKLPDLGHIENMDDENASIPCCVFEGNQQINTCDSQKRNGMPLMVLTQKRLETVKKKSRKRKDTLHTTLQAVTSPQKKKLHCHESCVSTYTSNTHIKRDAAQKKVIPNLQRNGDGDRKKERSLI